MEPDPEAVLPAGSVPNVEVALRAGALVIADLHLAPTGDERTERFIAWCDALASDVPQLVVMGDFFDTWVGAKQALMEGTREVLAGLKRLTERGTDVLMIPGNRDALMGAAFEGASGARLYAEGFIARFPISEVRAAFVHGDSLCTLDHDYLRLRKLWRKPFVRWVTRHAPLWVARRIGAGLRAQSETRKAFKLREEKSIRPAAVRALGEATGARQVVCGHAHETRDETLTPSGLRFVVVGAWEWQDDVFWVTPTGALIPYAEAP